MQSSITNLCVTKRSMTKCSMTKRLRASAALLAGMGLLGLSALPVARAMPSSPSGCGLPTHGLQDKQDQQDNKPDDKKPNDKNNPFSAEEHEQKSHSWGVVIAKQHGIMAIPVAAGGLSPLQRAQVVAARLGKLYQTGVHFRDPKNYAVGELNGQVVLAMYTGNSAGQAGEKKVELLFTIDAHMLQYFTQDKGQKSLSRADIAIFWRDLIIKALTQETDIAAPGGGSAKQDKDEWAHVPAGYARGQVPVPLRASQVRRSN